MIVDTHCHLDAAYCEGGPEATLSRAREAGVGAFVAIGVGSLAAARDVVALATRRPDVACTVGVHPHDATQLDDALFAELLELGRSPHVVAVGEIGLDHHYDHSPRDVQDAVFRRLIALARDLRKPVVIHTREAAEQTLAILEAEDARDVGGVIHCFSEDVAFARRALDLGFYLSFSGIVTFKSARSVKEAACFAPEDRLLVETDAPYLAPVPLRGKPNEPAYIVHTARHLSELRNTPFDRLVGATTENARRIFGGRLDGQVQADQNVK